MVYFTLMISGIDPNLSTLSTCSSYSEGWSWWVLVILAREKEREVWRCPCAGGSRCAADMLEMGWRVRWETYAGRILRSSWALGREFEFILIWSSFKWYLPCLLWGYR